MVTYAKIALTLLQLVEWLVNYLQKQKYYDEGYDKAVAEINAKMLRKSEYAKKLAEHFSSMPADAVDDFLRELEPK